MLHLLPARNADSGTEVASMEVVPPIAAQLVALAETEKQLTPKSSPTLKPGPYCAVFVQVVPVDNILFGSEMLGAVRDIDPETGYHFDDTKRYIDQVASLSETERYKIFEGNARKVYPRLDRALAARGKPGRP